MWSRFRYSFCGVVMHLIIIFKSQVHCLVSGMEAWRHGGFACLHANLHLKRKEKLGYSFQTIRPEKYAFH